MDLAGFCDKNIIVSDEALHCGGGRGVKPFFVRAKPCLPLWSFSLIRKTELLVAFNITSGIEVSFFSAKSRTLLIYRYQKKEDTLRNLYEKKKEKLISYICFLASLGLKVINILFLLHWLQCLSPAKTFFCYLELFNFSCFGVLEFIFKLIYTFFDAVQKY